MNINNRVISVSRNAVLNMFPISFAWAGGYSPWRYRVTEKILKREISLRKPSAVETTSSHSLDVRRSGGMHGGPVSGKCGLGGYPPSPRSVGITELAGK